MPPRPYHRDWSLEPAHLRPTGQGANPFYAQFEFVVKELKDCFRDIARDRTPVLTRSETASADQRAASRHARTGALREADTEFHEWYAPLRNATMTSRDFKRLFTRVFTNSDVDERPEAIAELDGWLSHVKRNRGMYPSPKSLPGEPLQIVDKSASAAEKRPVPDAGRRKQYESDASFALRAALASQGINKNGNPRLPHESSLHSLAVSHRRLSHRQQAIYGISQRAFARAGF
ncbi:hypothetical protein OF846_001179 [Rhodotorula toruloides]|nr:hypothetical protein OF846_001179 [Rhodotorula toruloides]